MFPPLETKPKQKASNSKIKRVEQNNLFLCRADTCDWKLSRTVLTLCAATEREDRLCSIYILPFFKRMLLGLSLILLMSHCFRRGLFSVDPPY